MAEGEWEIEREMAREREELISAVLRTRSCLCAVPSDENIDNDYHFLMDLGIHLNCIIHTTLRPMALGSLHGTLILRDI